MGTRDDSYSELTGERDTPQRACILNAINQAEGPLTVEEIFQIAKQSMPTLGLATIYRTVKLLQDARSIRLVTLPDGVSRYEPVSSGPHHFFCRICRRVFALPASQGDLFSQFRLGNGFYVERHESVFYGKCPECASGSPEEISEEKWT